MDLKEAILTRRTHKLYDGRDIPLAKIEDWLQTAIQAPNHRRNEPWSFTVVEKKDLMAFWRKLKPYMRQVLTTSTDEEIESKSAKLEKIFATAGALVFVMFKKDENGLIQQENYAAVCCVIQNLMLLAQSENIGSYWSTQKVFQSRLTDELIGYPSASYALAGAVFLGHPAGKPVPPDFQLVEKLHLWKSL